MVKNGENNMPLIGEYQSKLVAGYRLVIPKNLRQSLDDQLIITKGYEGCLVLVTNDQWQNLIKDVKDTTFLNRAVRDTTRFLVGSASPIKTDKQGRFVLPHSLRDYADISPTHNKVVFLGLINWVEIWSYDKWNDHQEFIWQNSESIAQELVNTSPNNTK